MTTGLRKVDQHALKFGNGATIVLLLLAFIINAPILVLFVAFAQLCGALNLSFAPYRLAYQALVQQNLLKPNIITDNPEPHRFAMLVGALFNGVGGALVLLAGSSIGWVLVWIVIALANLNFWLEFCAGCWMYYQFNRLGIKGFDVAPIKEGVNS
jgi:hypothetical protein